MCNNRIDYGNVKTKIIKVAEEREVIDPSGFQKYETFHGIQLFCFCMAETAFPRESELL